MVQLIYEPRLVLLQLSKVWQPFGPHVLMWKLCCCRGQLTKFLPVATCRILMSLAAKHTIIEGNTIGDARLLILLATEIR